MPEESPDDIVLPAAPPAPARQQAATPQVESLRKQARAALMSRRKAEARGVLARLVALSDDSNDQRNLADLIRGVEEELRTFSATSGDIARRLKEGASLESLQAELDQRIPHWRAFANDLPGLHLARAGLSAHDDPNLKEQLSHLENLLAGGSVGEVLDVWENMGAPTGVASPGFSQMLAMLDKLSDQLDSKNWKAAKTAHTDTQACLNEDECSTFREGVASYLRETGEIIDWECLVMECERAMPTPTRKDKQRLAEALYAANDGIERRVGKEPALKDLQARLAAMRDEIEGAAAPVTRGDSGLMWPIIILLLIVVTLAAIWFYYGLSNSQTTTNSPLRSPTCPEDRSLFAS